ncbi:hypothetical protein ACRAWF_31865 [Streptomyces sp. L7]
MNQDVSASGLSCGMIVAWQATVPAWPRLTTGTSRRCFWKTPTVPSRV